MRLDHLLSKEKVRRRRKRRRVSSEKIITTKARDVRSACCSIFFARFGSPEYGGVAQLGEHLPCKQGVKGSIPFISTNDGNEGIGKGLPIPESNGSVVNDSPVDCQSRP